MNSAPPVPLPRDFSDWYSPMIVKELRHGLRTRFFSVALIQFHVLLALLMSSALLGANEEVINGLFWFLALAVVLGVMPLRGFAALNSEATEGTLDMLTLTNMPALRVVYGKWAALFSQTLLVASSLLPYMVARYHFGGVEIVREIAALGIMVLGSALTTAALVAFSSQKSVLLRLLLAAGVILAAVTLGVFVVGLATESMGDSMADEFARVSGTEKLGLLAVILVIAGYGTYLLLTLGASRFAPASENHSTVKRLVGLGVMGIMAAAGVGLALGHATWQTAFWAFFPAMIFTILLGMDVMTEAMPRFPTVVASFTRGGRWRRMAGCFLYPGWAAGVPYYLLLCLAPLSIMAAMLWRHFDEDSMLCTLCLLSANVVPVCVPYLREQRFTNWWLVHIVLITTGVLLTMLADAMDVKEVIGLGMITPGTSLFGEFADWSQHRAIFIGGAISGGLWTLAALFLASKEMRVYRELETEAQSCLQTQLPGHANDPAS
ncbi:MAG: hypothetical protein U0984_16195 [Prosthecobacter sp.]|nr:hypothetical protein [Prosthecobacter sp.]